ncbi:MAG: hypothetical protein KF845_12075 [Cyclobacteriaceae bacterium]|nr:hypothetical protein [Cyclobacteriaceae bacterium]
MKQFLLNNLKNVFGWKAKRKIVVISVDDYGNVRLASKNAKQALDKAGLKVLSRFDAYDTLETKGDLEMLYEALTSVRDRNNKPAVFTPFALSCNINFEKMREEGYTRYIPELLTDTYNRLSLSDGNSYEGAWKLWKEGIKEGIMAPQFHGREHLNLKVFEEKLKLKDKELMACLEHNSYTSISNSGYKTISYTAAFEFDEFNENERFGQIIENGLDAFEKVYGYKSTHFNSPGGREHPVIHKYLREKGIKYIDTPWIKKEHLGKGKYKTIINYTGKKNHLNQIYLVRNVVFEPTHNRGINWVNYTLQQVEAAFLWNRPAIISSHRVNFCGHIDPKNREAGISALKTLLKKIVQKWPEVEFMAANELGELMASGK